MMAVISVDRTFGHYPASIGTSLAFEGLLHTGEYASDAKSIINDYGEIYINIRTLVRNAYGAFEDKKESVLTDVLITCIDEDLNAIKQAVGEYTSTVKIVPYICTYTRLNAFSHEAKFKNPNTEIQIAYNKLEHAVYKNIVDRQDPDIKIFDVKIEGSSKTIILTHYPIDLLCSKEFPTLVLLESHSGVVKKRLEWFTKLNGKPERIPFSKWSLVMFGDHILFSPLDLKSRNVLKRVAEKYRWTQETTMSRIDQCLKLANEPYLAQYVRRCSK